MSERAYTVEELDALRALIRNKLKNGVYDINAIPTIFRMNDTGRDYATSKVEELVRTHMLAGHTAQDLYASEQSPTQQEK